MYSNNNKRKRKESSYQRATMINFFETQKPISRQCPICELFFPEDKLETHASSCGLAFSTITSQNSTQQSLSQKTSPSKYTYEDGEDNGMEDEGIGETPLVAGKRKRTSPAEHKTQHDDREQKSPRALAKIERVGRQTFSLCF